MLLMAESSAMRVARSVGFERVAWALRRIHCPVPADALVLEVGSGGNPYGRANVLLDAYPETRERHWVPLTVDRPFVFGFLEKLPFKDKAFDFVIASHVVEHSPSPEQALAEMERVAAAGYIEVPDAFMERINPYKDHRSEITVRDNALVIRKKRAWRTDVELVELYEARAKHFVVTELIPSRPFAFHVRYYWRDRIAFQILNPGVDSTWQPPADDRRSPDRPTSRLAWRARAQRLFRRAFSQSRRNGRIDLTKLVACPTCPVRAPLERRATAFHCTACATDYPDRDGLPMLYPARL